jgi:hypothetical protein
MKNQLSPEDYGYSHDMTMEQLKTLSDKLSREQATELARLLKVASKAHFDHADELEKFRQRKLGTQAAND